MKHTDAAVFLLFGQSNAVGHILPMRQEDKILTPMKNVFGLSRTFNQSYENRALTWTGYTSFDMNLAETQDDTYSVANCLARMWQDAIDAGRELPDLYIIHIAIGAQGIMDRFMWYPDRPPKLVPGPLGVVDISMYPLALHILSLLDDSFAGMGKRYEIMGLHWRGGEEDTAIDVAQLDIHLEGIYRRMFREFRQAVSVPMPIYLHWIACPDRELDMDPTGAGLKRMHYINGLFDLLSRTSEDVHIYDVRKAPWYDPDVRGNRLFLDIDVVHFTEETNRWVAKTIMDGYLR